MCGITGIWRRKGNILASEIIRMSELIAHRGPDDMGHVLINTHGTLQMVHFVETKGLSEGYDLALANRRLSIIDLSPGGHQPMTRDGCTIVHNGEIYNYMELRKMLSEEGHSFSSKSDTEVLLHAYLEWGTECLSRLNGMFAFAIWDSRTQELFCARDRLGIKPFYYYLSSNEFIFASEIKSILTVLQQKPDVNEGTVYDFLSRGWLDHTDETFFKGILRLPAGSYMLIGRERIEIVKYWDLESHEPGYASLDESAERFRELFTDSIRLQMRSDVTVGCCLSGGMDSTAVVSVAAPQSPYRMRTFTARFSGDSLDEWPYVQAVSSRVPIDTVSVFVEPKEFWETLPDVLWAQEEPFIGPGIYAQWVLMRTIRSHDVPVVLDGQGGDELLCGYAKYFYFALRDMFSKGQVGKIALTLLSALFYGGRHLFDLGAAKRYLPKWLNHPTERWLQPEFIRQFGKRPMAHPKGDVKTQQILDIKTYSLPILLRYEDKNSMAHSIESRVPFLDHRLVEFAVSLPTEHKLHGAQAKQVMRYALTDMIPPEILRRRTKIGFGGSFSSWIPELRSLFEEWLRSSGLAIDRYAQREVLWSQLRNCNPILFRPLILDQWLERFGYA
jgi:asparagine synthase (glutamine-hydrolysing)